MRKIGTKLDEVIHTVDRCAHLTGRNVDFGANIAVSGGDLDWDRIWCCVRTWINRCWIALVFTQNIIMFSVKN